MRLRKEALKTIDPKSGINSKIIWFVCTRRTETWTCGKTTAIDCIIDTGEIVWCNRSRSSTDITIHPMNNYFCVNYKIEDFREITESEYAKYVLPELVENRIVGVPDYRFKTEQEFKECGDWNYANGCPEGWNVNGKMNGVLGQYLGRDLSKTVFINLSQDDSYLKPLKGTINGVTLSSWNWEPENITTAPLRDTPVQEKDNVIYRFKTVEEFKRDKQWIKSIGVPEGWNSTHKMNFALGQVLSETQSRLVQDSINKKSFHVQGLTGYLPNGPYDCGLGSWDWRVSNFVPASEIPPAPKEPVVKYRFKTRAEFVRDNLWDEVSECPSAWNKVMTPVLGVWLNDEQSKLVHESTKSVDFRNGNYNGVNLTTWVWSRQDFTTDPLPTWEPTPVPVYHDPVLQETSESIESIMDSVMGKPEGFSTAVVDDQYYNHIYSYMTKDESSRKVAKPDTTYIYSHMKHIPGSYIKFESEADFFKFDTYIYEITHRDEKSFSMQLGSYFNVKGEQRWTLSLYELKRYGIPVKQRKEEQRLDVLDLSKPESTIKSSKDTVDLLAKVSPVIEVGEEYVPSSMKKKKRILRR